MALRPNYWIFARFDKPGQTSKVLNMRGRGIGDIYLFGSWAQDDGSDKTARSKTYFTFQLEQGGKELKQVMHFTDRDELSLGSSSDYVDNPIEWGFPVMAGVDGTHNASYHRGSPILNTYSVPILVGESVDLGVDIVLKWGSGNSPLTAPTRVDDPYTPWMLGGAMYLMFGVVSY